MVEVHRNDENHHYEATLDGKVVGFVRFRHRQRPDGTWRDTVLYSLTDAEWPSAQKRLREILRDPVPVH